MIVLALELPIVDEMYKRHLLIKHLAIKARSKCERDPVSQKVSKIWD
jgi:hypothetical protein